jgi:hypothetical protein
MNLLLEVTGAREPAATVEMGEYDPVNQVWSTLSNATTVDEALEIFASGNTTQSGTTSFQKKKYKDREIEVADQDGDDTDT